MFIMISYDICDDGRRVAVCNILKNFGERVQRSVFECDISASQLKALRKKIADRIDAETDSVRFYLFCSACGEKVEAVGIEGPLSEDEGFFLV